MNPLISIVVPTKNRNAILRWTLSEFCKQTMQYGAFEIVVVNDGGAPFELADLPYQTTLVNLDESKGPATARNAGAEVSSGRILLFVGDDCLPDRNLVWRHWHEHSKRNFEPIAVQGYTDWHPDIPPDDFMNYLHEGVQANWPALRLPDGKWKDTAPGWFLTTNASISADLFRSEGRFNQRFPAAAWEDIELSYRLIRRGVTTYLSPDAINHHFHRITLDSYVQRQITEGRSRLVLCSAHPELSGQMLDPKGLRETNAEMLETAKVLAAELHFKSAPDVQEIRRGRWGQCLRLASLEGIRRGIAERGGIWQAIPHTHLDDSCRGVVAAASFVERGDPIYAEYEITTAMKAEPNNWALYAAWGEVLLASGKSNSARNVFETAARLGPGESWPTERMRMWQTQMR